MRENMKELSKTSIDYYILPNKIFCGMAGMWPIDEKSSKLSKLFAYFRVVVGLTAVNSVFVPQIMLIVSTWGDLKVLTGVGCVLTTVGQLLFKMLYLLAVKDKTYKLSKEMRDLWNSSDDPKERQSYEELAYWARKFTILFHASCMCNICTFTLAAASDYFTIDYSIENAEKSRHLPFEVWYGTDITASPRFEIAFACQLVASIIVASAIAGLDTTFMTTILHVCGQFRLINTWITNLGIEINVKPDYPRNLEANLIKCIRHHQRMINVVNDVNDFLAPIVFLQLLTSGIELCLSGFALLDNSSGPELVKFVSYLISMGVHLLLWCWPGEILIQESLEIGNVVYLNIPWYNLPVVYQRELCLMMVRAQQHCSITAFTFQTLSIHTLTAVFNTAASYFALLREIQQA